MLCTVMGWHVACEDSSTAVWDIKKKKKEVKETIKNAAVTSLKRTFCLHCLSPHLRKRQHVRTGPWHPPEQRLITQKKTTKKPNKPPTHNLDRHLLSLPIKTLISIPFSPKLSPVLQCSSCPPSTPPVCSREVKDDSSSSTGFPALRPHHQGPTRSCSGQTGPLKLPQFSTSPTWDLLQSRFLLVFYSESLFNY